MNSSRIVRLQTARVLPPACGDGETASLRNVFISGTENINPFACGISAILRISGANDRDVTLTDIDETNMVPDIDQHGENVIDGTISTAWGELLLS